MTYMQSHKEDVTRIEGRSEAEQDQIGKFAFQAGAFKATSLFYAQAADHAVALHKLTVRNPKRMVAAFIDQIAGPSCEDIAILLREVHDYLRLRPELEDVKFAIEEAVHAAEFQAEAEKGRMQEAIDAELAGKERLRANLIERGITTC